MNICKQILKTAKLQAIRNHRKQSKHKVKLFLNMATVLFNYHFVLNYGNKYKQIATMIELMPFRYSQNDFFYYGIDEHLLLTNSNTVIGNIPFDFSLVAHKSLNSIKETVNTTCQDQEYIGNLNSIIDAVIKYTKRIAENLKNENSVHAQKIADIFDKMEHSDANSMIDSCQRILLWNSLLHQSGHLLVGLGRIDIILEKYCKDVDDKVLEEFYKTLHKYYEYKSQILKGDTGQLIIIGGCRKDGEYICNEITIKTLDIFKTINLPDPKLMLRVSQNMPAALLKSAIECMGKGNGSPILTNDDVVIPRLIEYGYKESDVYSYGVSACWEPLIIGKSIDQNNLVNINIPYCLNKSIYKKEYDSFDELKTDFLIELNESLNEVIRYSNEFTFEDDPLLTLLSFQCWKNEQDLGTGGAVYNNYGLLLAGIGNAINSLLNIKQYVFEKNIVSFSRVKTILNDNFVNDEELRIELMHNNQYGRDNPDVVKLTNEIFGFIKNKLVGVHNKYGGRYKIGLSSPAYIDEGMKTSATFDGRKKYAPFNTHISCDGAPLTEILQFASRIDYSNGGFNGNVIDAIVPPNLFDNDIVNKLFICINSAIKMGIFEMQLNVFSYRQLMDAKAHPEKYTNLIVRVWGFSAYFNDLPEEYKDNLIKRARETEHID